jgi:hypothetical protein
MLRFRWNEWNTAHIEEHGVSRDEAEYVVKRARDPFPQKRGDGKLLVWGQLPEGRYLQVIYILDVVDEEDELPSDVDLLDLLNNDPQIAYVIHARDLNDAEKRRFRQFRRGR